MHTDQNKKSVAVKKRKNVIVSCIYRAPGSNVELFKEWMEKMFSVNNQKDLFICGDYNIDLLNAKKHKSTEEFVDVMFSMCLFPKITKPSRITSHSATLIDNIFTNILDNNTVSGLLLNDTCDHLPVFVVYDVNYRRVMNTDRSKYIREQKNQSMLSKLT